MRSHRSGGCTKQLAGTISGACRVLLLLGIVTLLMLAVGPAALNAQQTLELEWSEPAAGERISDAPSEIRLGFTETLDRDHSQADLLDQSGESLANETIVDQSNPSELVLSPRSTLPDGVYTVRWQVATSNGESEHSGHFAIEVGEAGALPSAPPESQFGESSSVLPAIGRTMMLLGATAASGLLLLWIVALRPALQNHGRPVRGIASRVRLLALLALVISAIGGGIGLFAETSRTGRTLADALTGTATGSSLMLHLAHVILFAAVLAIPGIWRSRTDRRVCGVALGAGAAALVPLAMSSHSGQQLVGSAPATANHWLHLAAMGIWTGGILCAAIITETSHVDWRGPAGRQFARTLGILVLGSIPVLGLTGLYAYHLNTGNLAALRTTEYGEILTIKLILSGLAAILVLGGLLGSRIIPSVPHGRRITTFGLPVTFVLVLGITGTGALLNGQDQTARDAYLASQERQSREFDADELSGALYITPGVPGHNRITLDLSAPGAALSDTAQTAIRVRSADLYGGDRQIVLHPEDICTADGEVIDSPIARFEADGLDLSVGGQWDIDVQIQRIDGPNLTVPVSLELPEQSADDRLSPPLRFTGVQATLGVLSGAGVFILGGLVFSRYRRDGRLPDVLSLLMMVVLVFTVLALWNGRITHTPEAQARNPIPRTLESVETGRELYLEHCAVCHGEDARGSGEDISQLDRPPADLTASHMDTHPAGDIAYWIEHGIDPAMPGAGETLSEEETWHLVNFLRSLRHPVE